MEPRREAVPAENPEPEERGLEEEGDKALDRERGPEDVADKPRVHGPVHAELELLNEARRDCDRDVDEVKRPEEVGELEPLLVLRSVPHRLEDDEDGPKAQCQRDEEEVVDRRRRELETCKRDSGDGDD